MGTLNSVPAKGLSGDVGIVYERANVTFIWTAMVIC